MEIQKIFSDMYDEERLYSVLMSEEEMYLFSEAKRNLEDYESHRGLGRSYLLGGIGGMVGGYAGKKEAEKLSREGVSDRDIVTKSRNKAGHVGAAVGAGVGALTGGAIAGRSAYKNLVQGNLQEVMSKEAIKKIKSKAGREAAAEAARAAKKANRALKNKAGAIALGGALAMGALGAGTGYFGGRAGANKNSRDRIAKKNLDEWK